MSDEMIEAAQVQRMERLNRDAANERIAELADAFNKVCAENADFVAESIKTDRRITELEAELTMRREQAEGLQNQWVKDTQKIVALEADVKTLKKYAREIEIEYSQSEEKVKTLRKDAEVRDKHDDGMAIVPVEPTYHMLVKGCEKCFGRADKTLYARMKVAYKAMLAASK